MTIKEGGSITFVQRVFSLKKSGFITFAQRAFSGFCFVFAICFSKPPCGPTMHSKWSLPVCPNRLATNC